MKKYVPDASIILKWVIGEEKDTDDALALLKGWLNQEHDFIVPALWRFEVGNVLGLKRPKEAEAILNLLSAYQFEETTLSAEMVHITFDLMHDHRGVSFYDACYHAVAIAIKGTMVTADKTYYSKVKSMGSILLVGKG